MRDVSIGSIRTAAAVAAAGTMLATGPLALAATPTARAAARGGQIHVFVKILNQTKGTILITGAIGDYGTTVTTDKNGKIDANGVYQRVHLQQGTLVIDAAGLDKSIAHVKPQPKQGSCSLSFTASGASKIVSGTGTYAGATGSLKLTATFAGLLPKTKSGTCSMSGNVSLFGSFQTVRGSGSIALK